ncbi:sugar ABC transporter permease [Burkholderia ubonensis]|uniref:carbohydrate ABC transporter permease n=1 Tax=Burkholderia ubonensis TaxID=101571 RepID=UPI00075E71FE|nr:sugar ABC transporter permease [Burkholderia ubonensis]KVD30155.1 sugar ABC transporter permease [Burkholderia ubonensis]KVT84422.1 sugar ABC transporter permease [Burkholderia ubonensis]
MRKQASVSGQFDAWLPQFVISPAFAISLIFFYALALWVGVISMTDSHSLPAYTWAGLSNYVALWADDNWWVAVVNLLKFLPLAVGLPLVLGCFLAMLLDRRIRGEGVLRTIYLYPVALSFVVSGTIWRWLLAPDTGIQSWLQSAGFHDARFDWLISPDRAIYTLAIVSVWQSTGFVVALFMAGLRSIDDSIFKAAMIDGASLPRIYWRIVLPILRPTVFSAVMILLPAALRTFDLVVILTNGGPGRSSILPAYYMFDMFFHRDEMGQGAASGVILLMMCSVVVAPYLITEFRRHRVESA